MEHEWSVFGIIHNAPFQFGQKFAQPNNLTLKQPVMYFWKFTKLTSHGEVKGQNLAYFDRMRHNLAQWHNLTLLTSLRNNFLFFSESKMAAGCKKSRFFLLISTQKLPNSCANGSCSFDLDTIWQKVTTWLQKQTCGRIFDLSQNRKWRGQLPLLKITKSSITWKLDPFFSRPMFSRVKNARKLSYAFYKTQNGRPLGQNWRFETYHLFARRYT